MLSNWKIFSHECQTKVTLVTKHPSAVANLKKLEDYGSTIVHEVDANTMSQHPLLNVKAFDRIVFNFPHAGLNYFMYEHSMVQIE